MRWLARWARSVADIIDPPCNCGEADGCRRHSRPSGSLWLDSGPFDELVLPDQRGETTMGYRLTEIDRLTVEIRELNTRLGWRTGDNTFGDYVALLHSEVSEMVEAYRDHNLTDATPTERAPVWRDTDPPVLLGWKPNKPEGVGSEVADVAIRLLDMADVFGYAIDRETIRSWRGDYRLVTSLRTFGDYCAYLHLRISYVLEAYLYRTVSDSVPGDMSFGLTVTLSSLEQMCETFDLDLESEVARKMAYNATRPYRHGRGTLATARSELGA